MNILIIVPTYNEEGSIGALTEQVLAQSEQCHILIVDDNSKDQTQSIVLQNAVKYPGRIHLLARSGKLGLGTAYIEGFRWGLARNYDYLIQMDADLSHQPGYLKVFIKNLEKNDLVIGSRYVPGGGTRNWPFLRQCISRAGSLYARMLLGFHLRDATGGFNGWRRELLQSIPLEQIRSNGYSFQIELKYRAYQRGSRILEIPIIFVERESGVSKMSLSITIEAIIKIFWIRFA